MAVEDVVKILELTEMAEHLPASYNIENSKLSAYLEAITNQLNKLIKAIKDTEKINDFDFIFGKSIDYLGSDYEEERKGEEDRYFLNRIKMKKIASGSLGDENSIINGIAGYFNYKDNRVQVRNIATRKIEVTYPAELEEEKVIFCLSNLKAAGIRYMMTKDIFWEDLTYAQIAETTYDKLAKLRYQRGYAPAWADYRYDQLAENTYEQLAKLNYTRRDGNNGGKI